MEVLCPWCVEAKRPTYNKRKLSIKVENHLVNCWVCGYRSRNLFHLIRRWFPSRVAEYLDLVPEATGRGFRDSETYSEEDPAGHTVQLPRGWSLLAEHTSSQDPMVRSALTYLRGRGVMSKDDLWWWKFGVAPEELPWRVILPSFDRLGRLSFWSARSTLANPKIPYWNSQAPRTGLVWNEVHVDWNQDLLVTEGPFDLVACGPDANATILLGSRLGPKHLLFQRILEHKTPVTLGLDPDKKRETIRIGKILHSLGVQVRVIRYPAQVEDLGSLQRKTISALRERAETFDPFASKVRMVLEDLV